MKLSNLALCVALASGAAALAANPAPAAVTVGIGIGIPGGYYGGHPGRWCYWHPGACGGYAGPYGAGAYWAGRGYWYNGRWWGRRYWRGGRWWYR